LKSGIGLKKLINIVSNAGESIRYHPSTGRFHTIILHNRECAWNPDQEFKNFVIDTLKYSGYDPKEF
jgi:hypothetical protein